MACLLSFAFAVAATAAENESGPRVDYEPYLRSDAIVRVHVVTATDTAATVDVETVYRGNVSKGRLTVRQNPHDALESDNDSFLFLSRAGDTFQVITAEVAFDSFEGVIRKTVASLPEWKPHGAISLISFTEDPVVTLRPGGGSSSTEFPWVGVWTGYRNDTDIPLDLDVSLIHPQIAVRAADGRSLARVHEFVPLKAACDKEGNTWNIDGQDIVDLGFIHLEPHETIVSTNMVLFELQRPREEIDITIDDGLYHFDPVHVLVLSEPAEPPAPCEGTTSGARPSPRS